MIHVLIYEEVRAIGEMITLTLHSESDIEVIGCSGSVEELRAYLHWCNVVLINSVEKGSNGPQVIRMVREAAPRTKIIVVGVKRDRDTIREWTEAGATGYVYRDESLREMLRMIRNGTGNDHRVAAPLREAPLLSYPVEQVVTEAQNGAAQTLFNTLTRREREVLRLVQQGLTNLEIAEALVIELGTVKNHVHNILRKLNINSRRDTFQLCRPAPYWNLAQTPAHANGNGHSPRRSPMRTLMPAVAVNAVPG